MTILRYSGDSKG